MKKGIIRQIRSRDGQLLVEAIIAMGIFTVAIVGIIGIVARAIHEGRTVGDQFIAANLAAEGLEATKNIIDSNVINHLSWNNGIGPGNYQVDYTSTSLGYPISVSGSSPSTQYNTPGLNPLSFNSSDETYDYSSGSQTAFKRYVSVNYITNYQIRVTCTVLWVTSSRAGNVGSLAVSTDFLNWR